jgi:hypothetical protein
VKSAKVEVTPKFGACPKPTIGNINSKTADNVLSNLVFIKVYFKSRKNFRNDTKVN